ncbi:MAG TPA: Uma2 family endonuclease [Candidatus Acidoferrales bacterium]|nr:Uma2 family endonuclease [Candidatus Acidoferrales bacterium]
MRMQLALRLSDHPLTDEELVEIARANPDLRFERSSSGELLVSPPTGGRSGRAEVELLAQLMEWNRKTGLGCVFSSSAGFNLPHQALRSPDASWVRLERWERLSDAEQIAFPRLCPDVVFELRSASDDLRQVQDKVREFVRHGASLGVLIDPYRRLVEIFRSGAEPQVVGPRAAMPLDPELPSFVLDAAAIIELANPAQPR